MGWASFCVSPGSLLRITNDFPNPSGTTFIVFAPTSSPSLTLHCSPFFPLDRRSPTSTSTILHYSHPARHRQSSSNLAALSLPLPPLLPFPPSPSPPSSLLRFPFFPGSASLAFSSHHPYSSPASEVLPIAACHYLALTDFRHPTELEDEFRRHRQHFHSTTTSRHFRGTITVASDIARV